MNVTLSHLINLKLLRTVTSDFFSMVNKNVPYYQWINIKITFITFWNFGSSMLFSFVLVWLYNYFDLSVSDESYILKHC